MFSIPLGDDLIEVELLEDPVVLSFFFNVLFLAFYDVLLGLGEVVHHVLVLGARLAVFKGGLVHDVAHRFLEGRVEGLACTERLVHRYIVRW